MEAILDFLLAHTPVAWGIVLVVGFCIGYCWRDLKEQRDWRKGHEIDASKREADARKMSEAIELLKEIVKRHDEDIHDLKQSTAGDRRSTGR